MSLILDVYKLLQDALRADQRGLTVQPDEYNRLVRLVSQNIFDDYIDSFEEDINNTDELSFLKVHDYEITLTAQASRNVAYGNMPGNYYQVIGKPWVLDGTTKRWVDVVTSLEDSEREDDYLTKSSITYPTARIGGVNSTGGVQIKVRPYTITSVFISYLREIAIPLLDYYTNDTTQVVTFLEAATTYSLPAGCTYRIGTVGGTGITVASQTVDLEWGEGDIGLLLAKMIQKIGASLPDEGLVTTGLADEVKIQG